MKKAIIVTPFDNYSYNVRIKYLENYLLEQGYTCDVISSDFDHRNKKHYKAKRNNLELLHVPEYSKNLSFSRIYSHYVFAKQVYKRLVETQPDLVYGSAPPNFLFKFIGKYKKKFVSTILIYEIGDMWPETLPLSDKLKKLFCVPLGIWASLRNCNLKIADFIIYECDLFRNSIQKYHRDVESQTIYLSKEDFYKGGKPNYVCSEIINIAYVGSINNIIDINGIVEILSWFSKTRRTVLHIIGDGEGKDELLNSCIEKGIEFNDHGIVYEDSLKKDILEKCQFGLNIMKPSVFVGATMKSLEYFHWGMILINNIPADTWDIVDKNHCGFNISSFEKREMSNLTQIVTNMGIDDLNQMRINSRNVYLQMFDEKRIHQQFNNVLLSLEKYGVRI